MRNVTSVTTGVWPMTNYDFSKAFLEVIFALKNMTISKISKIPAAGSRNFCIENNHKNVAGSICLI